MPKAYILAQITEIPDPEAYKTSGYMQMAEDSVAAFGGRFLVRGGNPEPLENTTTNQAAPARTVILEFPSRTQAQAFYHSAQYAPAIHLRQTLSKASLTLLDEFVPT